MSACEQGTVTSVDCIQKKWNSRLEVRKPFNLWIWKCFNIESWNEFGLILHFPGECWDGALQLLSEMPDRDLTAFGAAVSCCERRWVEALQVLHDMQHGGELLVDYVDWGVGACSDGPIKLFGSMLCGGRFAQWDVEYKHLDAREQNIPERFFQISTSAVVGRTSTKPYCLQCCHCCLRKRQRVYHEVAKKSREKVQVFQCGEFTKRYSCMQVDAHEHADSHEMLHLVTHPEAKGKSMEIRNMLIFVIYKEFIGRVFATAGEQWQRALHLLKECIEGKDCLSVATQQHLVKGGYYRYLRTSSSKGHNWLKHCCVT